MTAFYLQNDSESPDNVQDVVMPVQAAAEYSGYSLAYLCRLLNNGSVEGIQIGRVWLAKVASPDAYIKRARQQQDQRFGPRVFHAYLDEKRRVRLTHTEAALWAVRNEYAPPD